MGNKHNKGDKETKKTRSLHKSETEVITRKRARRTACLKKIEKKRFFCWAEELSVIPTLW